MKLLTLKAFKTTALVGAMFVAPVLVSHTPIAPMLSVQAIAQEDEEQETRRVPAMSPRVGRAFEPVLEVFEIEEPTEAQWRESLELLQSYDIERWNGYERAMFWRYQAGIYASLEDFENMKRCFEEMLAYRNDVQPRMEQDTILTLARLEAMEENWDGALRWLTEWWGLVPSPNVDAYELRAMINYNKSNFREALSDLDYVVAAEETESGKAKERNYQMQFGVYSELNRNADMLSVSETLVRHYPSRANWNRLWAMYLDRDDQQKALAAMQAAHDQGFLDRESHYSTFSSVWNQASNPYLAAKYFEEGMEAGIVEKSQKNWEYLANWWYQAREYRRSIQAREQAARTSDDGENYSLLARAELSEGMYEEAAQSAREALQKGGLRDTAEVHLIQGQAYLALKRYEDAKSAFLRAKEADGRSSRYADQFLTFAQTKLDVLARLEG